MNDSFGVNELGGIDDGTGDIVGAAVPQTKFGKSSKPLHTWSASWQMHSSYE